MADSEYTLAIRAQTNEFVKAIKDIEAKTKVIASQMSEIDKQLKIESVDRVQKLSEKPVLSKCLAKMPDEEAIIYGKKCKIDKET